MIGRDREVEGVSLYGGCNCKQGFWHTGVIGLSTESVIDKTRVSDVHDRWELRKYMIKQLILMGCHVISLRWREMVE